MSFNFNTADYRPSTNPMKGYFKSKQERWMEQVRQEEEVAAFMDANWYGSDKPFCFERVHDPYRQKHGVDVSIYDCDNEANHIYIDEKAKMGPDKYGKPYLNRILETLSFEVYKHEEKWGWLPGWFTWDQILTQAYCFESVFADCDTPEELTEDKISKVVCLVVHKERLWQQINKDLGLDPYSLTEKAREVVASFNPFLELAPGYMLFQSRKYEEAPVNLLIPRENILKIPNCWETTVPRVNNPVVITLNDCSDNNDNNNPLV